MKPQIQLLGMLLSAAFALATGAQQGHDMNQEMPHGDGMAQDMQQGHGMAHDTQQGHDMSQGEQERHSPMAHGASGMETATCDLGIRFSEAAERRLGGALYAKAMGHGQMGGETHQMGMASDSGEMKGHATHSGAEAPPSMHERHFAQYGGEQFFMAPDKLHHLEPVYSEHCGLRVIFYNAHTEPIRPERFRAFVHVIPSAKMEPERTRFLEVSADGSALEAALGSNLTRPFEVELYVRFPESDDPELFNVFIKK